MISKLDKATPFNTTNIIQPNTFLRNLDSKCPIKHKTLLDLTYQQKLSNSNQSKKPNIISFKLFLLVPITRVNLRRCQCPIPDLCTYLTMLLWGGGSSLQDEGFHLPRGGGAKNWKKGFFATPKEPRNFLPIFSKLLVNSIIKMQ